MKILITGALGHIGSRLIRVLPELQPGVKLTLLDNFATQRYNSLFDLPKQANLQFIEADVATYNLDPIVAQVDLAIHLAAMNDAAASFAQPELVAQHNYNATKAIALSCTKYQKALIFPSSTSIYAAKDLIIDEACPASAIQPQSPYAKAKLQEEQLLLELHQQHGLPLAICRFGTIFGTSPGMRFHTAVNKFCWQAVHSNTISVWQTALKQVRPYLCLSDAIAVLNFIISNNLFSGKIYNAVSLNATVAEVFGYITELLPNTNINLVAHPIMNDYSFTVVSRNLSNKNFVFKGGLRAGITETINLLQYNNSKYKESL